MYKAYKFRLYPNNQQKQKLNKTFGCNRFVYNYYLRKIISEGYINAYSCIKDYTNKLKYEYPFLLEANPLLIKKTIFNLQDNYKRHLNSGISIQNIEANMVKIVIQLKLFTINTVI